MLGPSLFAAVGLGFAFVPVTIAAVSGIAQHEAGLASGLINTSQQIGGALGLAVLSTVAFSQIEDGAAAAGGAPTPAILNEGYSDAFLVGAGIALLGLVATLILIRGRDSRAHVELGGALEPAAETPAGPEPGLAALVAQEPSSRRRPSAALSPRRLNISPSTGSASFISPFGRRSAS